MAYNFSLITVAAIWAMIPALSPAAGVSNTGQPGEVMQPVPADREAQRLYQEAARQKGGLSLYISPGGDDRNNGLSRETPFKSLVKARETVRRIKGLLEGSPPEGGITVHCAPGRYEVAATVAFDQQDSGVEGRRITYRAERPGTVTFTGGRLIPPEHATPITDAGIRKLFSAAVLSRLREIDLRKLGITNYGKFNEAGFNLRYVNPGLELFIDDVAFEISRYPNEGYVPVGKVIDKGSVPRQGDSNKRPGVFEYTDNKPDTWMPSDDIYVSGNFSAPWAPDTIRVARFDKTTKTIHLSRPHIYGIKTGAEYHNYYYRNILEEVDKPGEYYIDREKGRLYFCPFSPVNSGTRIEVSLLEGHVLSLIRASQITFQGLVIEAARGMGIYMNKTVSNLVEGCTVRNVGNIGIFMTGEKNGVRSTDIYNTSRGGVSMSGGDRRTLRPGGNFVRNCRIHDYNRHERSYRAAVNIGGVGNIIANNHAYSAPDMAILLSGNDHLIEYNYIHDVMRESGEGGWLYTGRNLSSHGNVVRYNFVHHVGVRPDGTKTERTGGACGLYIDDNSGGFTVYGNVFYQSGRGRGAVLYKDSDVVVTNNIFIQCERVLCARAYQYNKPEMIQKTYGEGSNFYKQLHSVNYLQPPYITRYPYIKDYLDLSIAGTPRRNVTANNLIVQCDKIFVKMPGADVGEKDNWITDTDPGFRDMKNMDFRLSPDSDVYTRIKGFTPIPWEKIGLYRDEYRPKLLDVPYADR